MRDPASRRDTHSCFAEQGNQVKNLNSVPARGSNGAPPLSCKHGAYLFFAKAGHWLKSWEGEGYATAVRPLRHASQKTYMESLQWRLVCRCGCSASTLFMKADALRPLFYFSCSAGYEPFPNGTLLTAAHPCFRPAS